MPDRRHRRTGHRTRRLPALGSGAVLALLAGCAAPRNVVDAHEAFDSTTTYSRTYAALDAQTCEAARRTLLSQGYVISSATHEQVRGRKSFQPQPESHVEVEFNVVCAKEGYAGKRTIAFVNAVQDRYALKKSASSASVGVGVLGSLSLPFTGSDDSLVKVASATISSASFYDRFFQIVERYLAGDPGQRLELPADADDAELPPMGPAGPASSATGRAGAPPALGAAASPGSATPAVAPRPAAAASSAVVGAPAAAPAAASSSSAASATTSTATSTAGASATATPAAAASAPAASAPRAAP